MFGFNFARRRDKALNLFKRAIDDMGSLIEDAKTRAEMWTFRAQAFQTKADELNKEIEGAKKTLDKLKQLLV